MASVKGKKREPAIDVFEAIPAGALLLDKRQCVLRVSQSFLEMFSFGSAQKVLGRNICAAVRCHEYDLEQEDTVRETSCGECRLRAALGAAFAAGRSTRELAMSFSLQRDRRRQLRSQCKISINPAGTSEEPWAVLVVDDVGRYKRREKSLMDSRDFFLSLIENFPALIWLAGPDQQLEYVNKHWLQFTGRTLDQEIGSGWADNVHPDDREEYFSQCRRARDVCRPFEIEYRLRRRDNTYRWMLNVGKPFFDLDGHFAGYIGASFDITERRLAEEELRRFEVLSENAKEMILFVDDAGRIIDANSAAVQAWGYSHGELLAMSVGELTHETERPQWEQALRHSVGALFESIQRRRDGSSFPVEVSVQGADISGQRVLMLIIRDITERKNTEVAMKYAVEAANAAYRAKGDFLANMSHEIRTPLNGIIGMVDLTMRANISEDLRDNLMIAKNCADSLLRIINDILDFSKLEAGKVSIEMLEFDLRDLVEKIVRAHVPRLEEKSLELQYQLPASLPRRIIADPYRLQQVLNNLIGNAAKFTEQGSVLVAIKAQEQREDSLVLQFSVTDTGIGIAPDKTGQIFQSFSQADGSQTRKYGGTGLGLAISKQLIELMGGKIWLTSAQQQGSTFTFTLPCRTGSLAPATAWSPPPVQDLVVSGRPLHLLVAEDNKENQLVTGLMLKSLGHTYVVANNGQEALDILERETFDAVLMDIQMPELDGLEATRILRQREKGENHLTVIALTAHALAGDRERFLSLGMDDYLAKPVALESLYSVLERLGRGEAPGVKAITFYNKPAQAEPPEMRRVLKDIAYQAELLARLLDDSNLPIAEVVADAIKSLALNHSLESVKDQAFQITLASRRGDLASARRFFQDLTDNLKQLKKMFFPGKQEKTEVKP